jgi:hypothetical protein
MDVGDVGFVRQLVEKNADQHGDVDPEHQPPGVFPQTKIHSAPDSGLIGCDYHTADEQRATP